ncbi:MAG: cupin domain-containing protein [Chloroflexi bacterium]|nr:cupin domain-containing protein [Chloroflexota bacterium]
MHLLASIARFPKIRGGTASVAILLAAVLITLSWGQVRAQEPPTLSSLTDGVTEVVRQVLGSTIPDTAPGQDLALSRVIIPAGEPIRLHTHPGPQFALIVEGTLTYTAHWGVVQVTRAAGTEDSREEFAGAGQTVELQVGDSLLEMPTLVHEARNATDTPVVIYLATLFPEGAPASAPFTGIVPSSSGGIAQDS